MNGQLRIVAEFMNLADSYAEELSNQEYLNLCDEIQTAHALVEHQPSNHQEYVVIDADHIITARCWRNMKRKYLSTMTDAVLHAERVERANERAKQRHIERIERSVDRFAVLSD